MTDAVISNQMPGQRASDTAISLVEFAGDFHWRVSVEDLDGLHPAGAAVISEWLERLRDAAYADRLDEAARLMGMVRDKIALERQWEADDRRSIESFRNGKGW